MTISADQNEAVFRYIGQADGTEGMALEDIEQGTITLDVRSSFGLMGCEAGEELGFGFEAGNDYSVKCFVSVHDLICREI